MAEFDGRMRRRRPTRIGPSFGMALSGGILFLLATTTFSQGNELDGTELLPTTTTSPRSSSSPPPPFDCRQPGQECLHDGICSMDGAHCDCSPSPHWFGAQCQLRRCAQRHNPCVNGAECEKTAASFQCHCPMGFDGIYCERQLATICDGGPGNVPCQHGICRLGAKLDEYRCECHPGWTGQNCSEVDHCLGNGCLNGHCVASSSGAGGHHCECRPGWGGENCELDVDECQAGGEGILCQNGGKCHNLFGSFFCQCPPRFIGQFCEQQNALDQCEPSPCLNGGQCQMDISATTANWALDVKQFDWHWQCLCPMGFEGPNCGQIIDDCALGRMTCVNGGQCVRPWLEEGMEANGASGGIIQRKWHPAQCKCPIGYHGDFCEMDVNECEQYGHQGGMCQNGATCMNRHGTYSCMCVGGFEGRHCEKNIDDCVDNLCYAGSTCLDGISRYNCLCAPDRVGNLCEFPNPCSANPCGHGQCFADPETGKHTCQCDDGWTGDDCSEDVDECAHPSTNRCFNGKCVNEVGTFRCECQNGYTDEYCMTLVKYCDAMPCQNGATCLNDLGRYDCICLPGYSGKHCEVRAYQELNKCYLGCENGGICRDPNAQQCECPPPYAGILCEIEKPDPCEENKCAHGAVCAPNPDYISYACQCPPYLAGQFCERRLAPCEGGYNPCVHGTCQKGFKWEEGEFGCDCLAGWGGQLCDRPEEENGREGNGDNTCPLAANPCQNGGQCIGGSEQRGGRGAAAPLHNSPASMSTFFECICPRGFIGPLCEQKSDDAPAQCARGCRNGGKCAQQKDGNWSCQCPLGYEGDECENEKNACLNMSCLNKGKCISLGGVDFRCDCAPGWTGKLCETIVKECEEMNIMCLHDGICENRLNNYRCQCARGYAGRHCEIAVPVDKFNRTDRADLDNCRRRDCEQKARNGKCDPECNLYACQFDGGDCSTKQAYPFERCLQPSYCAHVFADGKCDEICNNEKCLFDGFDCVPRPLAKCPRLAECAMRYANGQCDQQCNMAACGWDGGDCEREAERDPSEKPQILAGELMLVLAVQPAALFPSLLRQFLLTLSAHLRASLALSMEKEEAEDGSTPMVPKLFQWHSDSGIGRRIQIPSGLNVTSLYNVHYGGEEEEEGEGDDGQKNRRRRRRAMEEVVVHGVAVFLRVDVTMCNLLDWNMMQNGLANASIARHPQRSAVPHPPPAPMLGVHSPCFSGMESVAAYVGAANAKMALQDIGVPILQSEARLNEPKGNSFKTLYVLSLLMVSLVAATATVLVVKRQKAPKMKSAKTWRPPLFEQQNSKFGGGGGGSTCTLANLNNAQQQQQMAGTFWQHYPVATAGSCASSNMPLMMSHAASMTSLCSNQQAGGTNIYAHANAPEMAQMGFHHPLHQFYAPPHQPAAADYSQQFHHHFSSAIGAGRGGVAQFQNNPATTSSAPAEHGNGADAQQQRHAHHAHHQPAINNPNTTTASCSRSSSSGIGGSSTEHSPLGGAHHPNEEEQAKRQLLTELREFAVLSPRALLDAETQQPLEPWMVNKMNERGRTLLHLLFQNEHLMKAEDERVLLDNIELLFKAGVSIDAQDNEGSTALSLAVRNRKCAAVKKLVKEWEADPNLEDADDKTPLYHCCANLPTKEDVKIAEFLINEVADIRLDTLAKQRESPLMRCAAICSDLSLKIATLILERVEPTERMEFVNQTGETMRTALHVAAAVENVGMIRLLVENGANKEAVDKEAKTPLFIATENAQCKAIAALLELGADRNKTDINDTKIMEIATQPGFGEIAELFRQYPDHPQQHHFHGRQIVTAHHLKQQAPSGKRSPPGNEGKGGGESRQKGGLKRRNAAASGEKCASPASSSSSGHSNSGDSSAPKKAAFAHFDRPSPTIMAANNNNSSSSPPHPPLLLPPTASTSQCPCPPPLPTTNTTTAATTSSSSLLTPPNSDQSAYSTTPSPNHVLIHQQALLANQQIMARLAAAIQERPPGNGAANLTVRQLASGMGGGGDQLYAINGHPNHLIRPNSNWMINSGNNYYIPNGQQQQTLSNYQRQQHFVGGRNNNQNNHANNNNANNNIYAVPQQTAAQLAYAPAAGTSSGNFPSQFHQQQFYHAAHQQQSEFARSIGTTLDHFYPSPQADKLVEPIGGSRAIDFRTNLSFDGGAFSHQCAPSSSSTSSFLQQQNGTTIANGNSMSNSLTHLDDISENELLPKLISQELSNYGLGLGLNQVQQNWAGTIAGGGGGGCSSMTIPEQSSPEN